MTVEDEVMARLKKITERNDKWFAERDAEAKLATPADPQPVHVPPKRYVVFLYADYYPSGGMGDMEGSFDTMEEAQAFTKYDFPKDNYQIVDRDTWEVLEEGETNPTGYIEEEQVSLSRHPIPL